MVTCLTMLWACAGEVPRGLTRRTTDGVTLLGVDGGAGAGGLCAPCIDSAECGGPRDLCLLGAGGAMFCSRDCSNNPCPDGWSCEEIVGSVVVRQCMPPSGVCTAPPPGVDQGGARSPDRGAWWPRDASVTPPKPDSVAPKKDAPQVGGPCASVPKAVASGAGSAPSVYGGAWTPAPTQGCSFVDGEGRTVNLSATQHRMIYRVNELRALQTGVDGVQRPMLEADFCLQEFSQGYVESGPGGHSKMNLSMYPIPGGGAGSGGNFIGENYGAHGGYTSDPMAATDRLINGWWNSGSTNTGHRGNMLDPEWTKGGMGIVVKGSSAVSIQTFSRKYANWLWGWTPCTKPPKVNDPMSTIPNPL